MDASERRVLIGRCVFLSAAALAMAVAATRCGGNNCGPTGICPTPSASPSSTVTVCSQATSMTSFTANPSTINLGDAFTLTWTAPCGYVSLRIQDQAQFALNQATNGSYQLRPGLNGYPPATGNTVYEATNGDAAPRLYTTVTVRPTPDGPTPPPNCGNGTCGSGENCSNCQADCACTGGQTCQNGTCATPPPSCGNGTCGSGENCSTCPADCPCTGGKTCVSGSCQTITCPSGTSCNDGNSCTRNDRCQADNTTCSGTPFTCGTCQDCNGSVCTTRPNCCGNGSCEGGELCGCVADCSGQSCNDGNACTTGETCQGGGTCGGGSARNCNDSNSCTVDSCNSGTGCVNTPYTCTASGCSNNGVCDGNGGCGVPPAGTYSSSCSGCGNTGNCDGSGGCARICPGQTYCGCSSPSECTDNPGSWCMRCMSSCVCC